MMNAWLTCVFNIKLYIHTTIRVTSIHPTKQQWRAPSIFNCAEARFLERCGVFSFSTFYSTYSLLTSRLLNQTEIAYLIFFSTIQCNIMHHRIQSEIQIRREDGKKGRNQATDSTHVKRFLTYIWYKVKIELASIGRRIRM